MRYTFAELLEDKKLRTSVAKLAEKKELDFEDGRMVYEVEFESNGYEYSYEIDANDGSVISHEKERDD